MLDSVFFMWYIVLVFRGGFHMYIMRKSDEVRDTTVNIRVSIKEKEMVKRLASARGISVAAYLMALVRRDIKLS